jgi:hypothetical protein
VHVSLQKEDVVTKREMIDNAGVVIVSEIAEEAYHA